MTTREIVTLVCEGCGSEASDVATHTLAVDQRKRRETEACDSCWAPVLDLVEGGRRMTH